MFIFAFLLLLALLVSSGHLHAADTGTGAPTDYNICDNTFANEFFDGKTWGNLVLKQKIETELKVGNSGHYLKPRLPDAAYIPFEYYKANRCDKNGKIHSLFLFVHNDVLYGDIITSDGDHIKGARYVFELN